MLLHDNCPLFTVSVSVSFLVLQFLFQIVIRLLSRQDQVVIKPVSTYQSSGRLLPKQCPVIIKAVSVCYQTMHSCYRSSAKYYQSGVRLLSKQCPVIIKAVSVCYQTMYSCYHSSAEYYQSGVRLLSQQCLAVMKALYGRSLSMQCAAVREAVTVEISCYSVRLLFTKHVPACLK